MFKLPQFLNETAKSYVVVSWKFPRNFLKASWKFYGNFLETTTSYVVVSHVHHLFFFSDDENLIETATGVFSFIQRKSDGPGHAHFGKLGPES